VEQEKQIDQVYDNFVTASENVVEANKQLEQAADSNVYFRFHMLIFFLMVGSVHGQR